MSIIYLEGPDGAGKTELIKQIQKPNDIFFHNGVYGSPEIACANYLAQLKYYRDVQSETFGDFDLILDRGIFAEMIYGPIMRGTSVPTELAERVISQLASFNTQLIVCLPPFAYSFGTWANRQDVEYVKEINQYNRIYDKYKELLDDSRLNTIHYDFTQTKEFKDDGPKPV